MSRMERINSQLMREIGLILQREMSDPRLEFVSITHVNTSKDLRSAQVYFCVLGDENQAEAALESLASASGMIRRHVSQRLNLRNTPSLNFRYDKSLTQSAQLEETLKEIEDGHEDNH